MMINDVDLLSTANASNGRSRELPGTNQRTKANEQSQDVVDFALPKTLNNNNNYVSTRTSPKGRENYQNVVPQMRPMVAGGYKDAPALGAGVIGPGAHPLANHPPQQHHSTSSAVVKHSITTLEKKLPKFPFHRKKSDPTNHSTAAAKDRPRFVKCASIARLFGNTYSTQQSQQQKDGHAGQTNSDSAKAQQMAQSAKTVVKTERFKKCTDAQVDSGDIDQSSVQIKDFCDDKDLSVRALRSISKSLGRLWRKSHSVEISAPDPEFKVLYLGNVLTGWAKGECLFLCLIVRGLYAVHRFQFGRGQIR